MCIVSAGRNPAETLLFWKKKTGSTAGFAICYLGGLVNPKDQQATTSDLWFIAAEIAKEFVGVLAD